MILYYITILYWILCSVISFLCSIVGPFALSDGHFIVYSSICVFWFPPWYLQTFPNTNIWLPIYFDLHLNHYQHFITYLFWPPFKPLPTFDYLFILTFKPLVSLNVYYWFILYLSEVSVFVLSLTNRFYTSKPFRQFNHKHSLTLLVYLHLFLQS